MLSRRKWNGTNHGPGIKQGGLSAGSMHHSQRPEPSESDAPSRIFAQSSVPRIDRERGVAACGCGTDGLCKFLWCRRLINRPGHHFQVLHGTRREAHFCQNRAAVGRSRGLSDRSSFASASVDCYEIPLAAAWHAPSCRAADFFMKRCSTQDSS